MYVDVLESLLLKAIIYCFTYKTLHIKGLWLQLFQVSSGRGLWFNVTCSVRICA